MNNENLDRMIKTTQHKAEKLAKRLMIQALDETDDDVVVLVGAFCIALRVLIDTNPVMNQKDSFDFVVSFLRNLEIKGVSE